MAIFQTEIQDTVQSLVGSVREMNISLKLLQSDVATVQTVTSRKVGDLTASLEQSTQADRTLRSSVEQDILYLNTTVARCSETTSSITQDLETVLQFKVQTEEKMANLSTMGSRVIDSGALPSREELVTEVQEVIFRKLGPVLRWMDNKAKEKGIGTACSTDAECWVDYSECRQSSCSCTPGRSYDAEKTACVESCETYGTDFQEVAGYYIAGRNKNSISDVSLDQCKLDCVRIKSFVCKTAEYWVETKTCNLQEVTKLEVSESLWLSYKNHVVHIQRDCLVPE